jgi:hypothetical protein
MHLFDNFESRSLDFYDRSLVVHSPDGNVTTKISKKFGWTTYLSIEDDFSPKHKHRIELIYQMKNPVPIESMPKYLFLVPNYCTDNFNPNIHLSIWDVDGQCYDIGKEKYPFAGKIIWEIDSDKYYYRNIIVDQIRWIVNIRAKDNMTKNVMHILEIKMVGSHKDGDPTKLSNNQYIDDKFKSEYYNQQNNYLEIKNNIFEDSNKTFHPYGVKTMFKHIKPYQYDLPIKKLSEYYGQNEYIDKVLNYFSSFNTKKNNDNKSQPEKKRLDMFGIEKDAADWIMTEYVKCREKCFVLCIWRPGLYGLEEIINVLQKNGYIYYLRKHCLTKRQLENLFFWMYDEFDYDRRNHIVDKKMDSIDVIDDINDVVFIIFDNVLDKEIGGIKSPFKCELRKIARKSHPNGNKYDGNDFLHINDHFYQTIEYCQILLNKNSLNWLGQQNCKNLISPYMKESNLISQTLRKSIYTNFNLLDINGIMFIKFYYADCRFIIEDFNAIIMKDNHKIEKKISKINDTIRHVSSLIKCNIIPNENNPSQIFFDPSKFFYFLGFKILNRNND